MYVLPVQQAGDTAQTDNWELQHIIKLVIEVNTFPVR